MCFARRIHRAEYGIARVQRAAADEDRQLSEHPLFRGAELAVAPGDCRAQRAMPIRSIALTAAQQLESESLQDGARSEQPGARRGELDCQRQLIQSCAQLANRGRVVRGQLEGRIDGASSIHEQRDTVGFRQRLDVQKLLQSQVEWLATGHQQPYGWAFLQQARQLDCRRLQLLHIVEDQQAVALGELFLESLRHRLLAGVADPNALADGAQYE